MLIETGGLVAFNDSQMIAILLARRQHNAHGLCTE